MSCPSFPFPLTAAQAAAFRADLAEETRLATSLVRFNGLTERHADRAAGDMLALMRAKIAGRG